MTTALLLRTLPPPANQASFARQVAGALASLQRIHLDRANDGALLADAEIREAVRRAGSVALEQTGRHPVGARLDAAIAVLCGEPGAPWPMTRPAHQRELLCALIHLARARLAVIRGPLPTAREQLAAARAVLDRIGREETMIMWFRIAKAALSLDEAERRLDLLAPEAA